jgi:ABC-type amino acid transport substrate-binding protein
MSEKQRKIIEQFDPLGRDGELGRFYRHIGKVPPPWTLRLHNQELLEAHRQGRAFIAAVNDREGLLDIPEISQAVDILSRACEAVEITYEMPKNAPKHRDKIKELFDQANETLEPLYAQGFKIDISTYLY